MFEYYYKRIWDREIAHRITHSPMPISQPETTVRFMAESVNHYTSFPILLPSLQFSIHILSIDLKVALLIYL
ncbi:MAG: hypothetical protein AAFY63_18050 [Cyanobacteria bacterium J06643_13]